MGEMALKKQVCCLYVESTRMALKAMKLPVTLAEL